MIVEYTRYRITQERQKAFEQAYQSAQQYLQASPHCLRYELTHCTEEPERYVLRIEWVSEERHLQGFRKEPNFQSFFALVKPYFSNIEEMQHYELTEVVGNGSASDEKKSVA
jgi:hemoglobin